MVDDDKSDGVVVDAVVSSDAPSTDNVVILDNRAVEGATVTVDSPASSDPTNIQGSWLWVKDDSGHASVTVTLVFVSFWVTTFIYIVSELSSIFHLSAVPFSVSASGAYFIPVLTLYGARRWTTSKYGDPAKGIKKP